jgi:hypothetical protein
VNDGIQFEGDFIKGKTHEDTIIELFEKYNDTEILDQSYFGHLTKKFAP